MGRGIQIDHDILRAYWPDAVRVLPSGECPVCHDDSEYSFVLPEFDQFTPDGTYQNCGYWCSNCGWSNAGSREISQMDIQAHGGGGQEEP